MSKEVIFFILPGLSNGGCEIAMQKFAKILINDFEVRLIVLGGEKQKVGDGELTVSFYSKTLLKSIPRLFSFLIRFKMQNRNKKVSFISSMNYINVIVAPILKIIFPFQKLILTERNVLLVPKRTKRIIRFEIIKLLMFFSYRFGDSIVAVSNDVLSDIKKLTLISEKKLHVIYNPIISNEEINKRIANRLIKKELNHKNKINIISVGRLVPQKGFDYLIKSIQKLNEISSKEFFLSIYGEGYLRNYLKSLIENLKLNDQIFLKGYSEELEKEYKQSDLFVMTSLFEGLPGALLEAMSFGLPVAAVECRGGVSEILEGGKWGTLIKNHNPDVIANSILNTIDSPINPIDRISDFTNQNSLNKYLELIK